MLGIEKPGYVYLVRGNLLGVEVDVWGRWSTDADVDTGIDTGPIYFQEAFRLKDLKLQQVFDNIIELGIKGFSNLLNDIIDNNKLDLYEQDQTKATSYKRRKPEESEISQDDFKSLSSRELSNKINSLQDPYPNAFIRCKDGSILYLKSSDYKE